MTEPIPAAIIMIVFPLTDITTPAGDFLPGAMSAWLAGARS
jgi:hypothetical protein